MLWAGYIKTEPLQDEYIDLTELSKRQPFWSTINVGVSKNRGTPKMDGL